MADFHDLKGYQVARWQQLMDQHNVEFDPQLFPDGYYHDSKEELDKLSEENPKQAIVVLLVKSIESILQVNDNWKLFFMNRELSDEYRDVLLQYQQFNTKVEA